MRSTSCKEIAQDLLDRSITGHPPDHLPPELLDENCGSALFGILVEGLADRFEPSLCDTYALLFSQAIAHTVEGVDAGGLVARYQRVRQMRPVAVQPSEILVLSRVTLGADVAVTSVLLAAAKQRFPEARIGFVAPHKNFELFAGDPRLHHVPVTYHRGGLRDRLAVWDELKTLAAAPDSIVLDPDSRLTQLGLLPICSEDRYHFFESRAYAAFQLSKVGQDSSCGGLQPDPVPQPHSAERGRTLSELAADWASETLGIKDAQPYLALSKEAAAHRAPYIAINLGVGENPAKRIPDPFEENLLSLLAATGMPLYIDKGAGGDEADRVVRAVERSGVRATFWEGSFAGFAQIIAASQLYVGYDSAGQHVAAASGIPLISIFAGFPAPRMFDRWRPSGERCRVIRVDRPDPAETLAKVQFALEDLRS